MQILITFIILPVVTNYAALSDTSKDPSKASRPKTTTLKPLVKDISIAPTDAPTSLTTSALRLYPPQSKTQQETKIRVVLPQQPRTVTKLAKTFYVGLSPSFSKDYFEPFERRVRPITLVAFRKNGFAPRHLVKVINSKSAEIAELQSPYNDISTFWQDEPDVKIKV